MYFFDYGNAFLLESSRAGAEIVAEDGENSVIRRMFKTLWDLCVSTTALVHSGGYVLAASLI